MQQRTLEGALPRMLGGARPLCAPINGPLDTPPVGRAMAAVTLYCGVAMTCTVRSQSGTFMRGRCLANGKQPTKQFGLIMTVYSAIHGAATGAAGWSAAALPSAFAVYWPTSARCALRSTACH